MRPQPIRICIALTTLLALPAAGQGVKTETYKTVGERKLQIHVHTPPDWTPQDKRPAIVFFFGGGWTGGSVKQFLPQAEYLASRGLVAARADYRVKSRDGVTPDACVEDARSAVRWLRANAARLGIDPEKLIASGGSAGGHLAACTMIPKSVEAEGDDLAVTTVPRAMVLFNPVLSFEHEKIITRLGDRKNLARKISPTAHLDKTTPPALILFGTNDRLKAFGDAYWEKAEELGVRADKFIAEGQGHGFFNRSPWREKTLIAVDEFLASLGLLEGAPTVQVPESERKGGGQRGQSRPRTRDELMKRWRAMDTNGDGRLSRDETAGALKRNFDRVDSDGNKAIDEAEIEALAERLARER